MINLILEISGFAHDKEEKKQYVHNRWLPAVNNLLDKYEMEEWHSETLWALEIKWSNRYLEKPRELKSLLQFCDRNNLNSALTTLDQEGTREEGGIRLSFVPASVYAYVVGVNTLGKKGTHIAYFQNPNP